MQESDENITFGKSLGLSLQKLQPHQANWARMQMSNILYQAQCWQNPQMPPTSVSVSSSSVLQEIHYNTENQGPEQDHFPAHASLAAFKY